MNGIFQRLLQFALAHIADVPQLVKLCLSVISAVKTGDLRAEAVALKELVDFIVAALGAGHTYAVNQHYDFEGKLDQYGVTPAEKSAILDMAGIAE